MAKEAAHRITRYVREKCGDGLRTVALVTADGWDGIYLRDDLKEQYGKSTYTEAVEIFRPTETTDFSNDVTLPLGSRHASVFFHEDAFVIRFRYSLDEYILVSIGPEAGRDLLEFIDDCKRIVQET